VELALRERGIEFERAQVGDRYVMERLLANNWLLGGEGSGHLVIRDCTSTGDGIISALQVMLVIYKSGKTLAELRRGMTKLPQTMINVRVAERFDPLARDDIREAVRQAEQTLGNAGRVLLRASGTEPVIRVMVEGQSQTDIARVATALAQAVERSSS